MIAALTIFSLTVLAQDTTKPKSKMKMEQMKYSCPMHPDVTSNKPGKCSKCGMDMKKSKKEQMKMDVMKMYSCPMHSDISSDRPGKCSKCGMDLKEIPAVVYACPMKCEGDKTYEKPGSCPKCGMNLKEKVVKKDEHEGHNHE